MVASDLLAKRIGTDFANYTHAIVNVYNIIMIYILVTHKSEKEEKKTPRLFAGLLLQQDIMAFQSRKSHMTAAVAVERVVWRQQLRVYTRGRKRISPRIHTHTNPKNWVGGGGCQKLYGRGAGEWRVQFNFYHYSMRVCLRVWVYVCAVAVHGDLLPLAEMYKATRPERGTLFGRDKNDNKFPKSNLLRIEMDIGAAHLLHPFAVLFFFVVFRFCFCCCCCCSCLGDYILHS